MLSNFVWGDLSRAANRPLTGITAPIDKRYSHNLSIVL